MNCKLCRISDGPLGFFLSLGRGPTVRVPCCCCAICREPGAFWGDKAYDADWLCDERCDDVFLNAIIIAASSSGSEIMLLLALGIVAGPLVGTDVTEAGCRRRVSWE
ncbi:hypothetical protein [Paracoccus sp. MKU1]|uniref:hypothetical protein n=1 Tax=Paracoccus sp. MKU1 TaxID=1745182 RepID=UPI00128EECAB